MSALLDGVLDAHGGLQRWRAAETVHGRVRTGGLLLRTRVPGNRFADYRITVHVQQARTVLDPFPRDGYRGVFESGQVRIESHDGAVISSRAPASGVLRTLGPAPEHPVGPAGLGLFRRLRDVELPHHAVPVDARRRGGRGGAPWQQEGETWRRLIVSFPPDIDTHSPRQTFYVDASGLLRRHDYVGGRWPLGTGSSLLRRPRGCRRVCIPDLPVGPPDRPGNRSLPFPTLVSILLTDIRVETD